MALFQRRSSAERSLLNACSELGAEAGLCAVGAASDGDLLAFLDTNRESMPTGNGKGGQANQMAEWAELLIDSILDDLAEPVAVPRPSDDFYDEILDVAGFPRNEENRLGVRRMTGQSFNLKAAQFLTGVLRDKAEIDRFVDVRVRRVMLKSSGDSAGPGGFLGGDRNRSLLELWDD